MKHQLFLLFLLFTFSGFAQNQLSVLTLNIWQEGTKVQSGYEAVVNEIARLQPDFVMLTEVRNYKNTRFCDRITQSLNEKGLTYYSFYSNDSGLLSKYPITDSAVIFPWKNDHGSIYKLKTRVNGKPFAVYTAHLDYLNCAYYMPRGYDPNTWKKLSNPVIDTVEINFVNLASMRDDAIQLFIADAEKEFEKGSNILLGGDFNEPSLLDWTEKTKNLYDHNTVVFQWTISKLLLQAGYVDVYRKIYPDVLKNPSFTYPAYLETMPIKKVTWAPDADERERIDFIYYKSHGDILPLSAKILGPRESICKSKKIKEQTDDKFIEPLGIWPTDHKGVFAVFRMF